MNEQGSDRDRRPSVGGRRRVTPTYAGELLFQEGTSPEEAGVPEPCPSVAVDGGMRIERNRGVPLADGTKIYVDVFRPEAGERVPALIAWSPYGKSNGGTTAYEVFRDESGRKGGGVRPEWISPYTPFEGPDPGRWCEAGYAVVNVDPRATWWSEGDYASIWDEREAGDCADVISWAAAEPWCSGKVGMSGVSYLAIAQWWAASVRPPALAAINPCEGLSDPYREFAFHGGIPSEFPAFWQKFRLKFSTAKVEAMADMMGLHPLDDDYWASKRPDLSRIEVPAYVIASWSDQGLHTRGTLAAFEQISSAHKFLEVHGRKKWAYYHSPPSVERQRQFFDRFLKDVDNGVDDWPRIRLETRIAFYRGLERKPAEWPPAETGFRNLFLDAENRALVDEQPAASATARYETGGDDDEVGFEYVFGEPVDVIGGMKLRLWVEAEGSDDMDLFVAIEKLDRHGQTVDFPFANVLEHGPAALGWLRVSHRALDTGRSTENRPWHTHLREDRLVPGQVVDVEVEVWPSGTRFEEGEGIRLVVRGSDPYAGSMASLGHRSTRSSGTHVIHTGGNHDSYLVVPILPPVPDAGDWPVAGA